MNMKWINRDKFGYNWSNCYSDQSVGVVFFLSLQHTTVYRFFFSSKNDVCLSVWSPKFFWCTMIWSEVGRVSFQLNACLFLVFSSQTVSTPQETFPTLRERSQRSGNVPTADKTVKRYPDKPFCKLLQNACSHCSTPSDPDVPFFPTDYLKGVSCFTTNNAAILGCFTNHSTSRRDAMIEVYRTNDWEKFYETLCP